MPHPTPVRVRAVLAAAAAVVLTALAPSPASAAGMSRFEWRVSAEINAIRAQHGLPAVTHRGLLSGAAGRHAARLRRSGRLVHSSTSRLARRAGSPVGEVIAWSSRRRTSARSIVRRWMQSPGHRAVLLDGRFRRIGVGASRGRGGLFVTAALSGR